MRAEVGDIIRCHFFNKAAGTYSIHPHGMRYDGTNSGADLFSLQTTSGVTSAGGKVRRLCRGRPSADFGNQSSQLKARLCRPPPLHHHSARHLTAPQTPRHVLPGHLRRHVHVLVVRQ